MSQNFLKLPSGHVVNVEQLLVIAHAGLNQYGLVFKGSNSVINVDAVDAEALQTFLDPYVIHKTKEQEVVIETSTEIPPSRE